MYENNHHTHYAVQYFITGKNNTYMGSSFMLCHHYEEHGEAFLGRIAEGDVTWVFHYIPDIKAELMTQKHPQSLVKISSSQCSLLVK
jgi:hypothetical protein